jgi:membrane fusion protein (multidrug efflux system)
MSPRFRLIALAGAATVLAACGGEPAPQQAPPPPPVQVVQVQPQTVSLERDFVGRLAPFRSADVRARVPGVLLERTYDEGSDVTEGDVLFRIDPAPLQAEVGAARAALAQAEANHTNARVAAERGRELAPRNYISQADIDNLEAAERSAEAAVQQARAALRSAQINLDYATVRAPISGRAGNQQVTEGALVGQGAATLLTTVDQIDMLYANFSMSVSELDQLRRAQDEGSVELLGTGQTPVQVLLSGGEVYEQPGTLDFSGVNVDPATGSVSLRAQVPNPRQRLLPGTFVTLKVKLGQRHGVYALPQAAVLRDASGAYVLTVNADNVVVRKPVVTEFARDGQWFITEGLAPGDTVIVSGLQKARPDEPVTPSPWQPGQPAGDGGAAAPQDASAGAGAQGAGAGANRPANAGDDAASSGAGTGPANDSAGGTGTDAGPASSAAQPPPADASAAQSAQAQAPSDQD